VTWLKLKSLEIFLSQLFHGCEKLKSLVLINMKYLSS
jgi:hypothetical protein